MFPYSVLFIYLFIIFIYLFIFRNKHTHTRERERGLTAEKPSNVQRGNKGKRLISNGKSKRATKV